MVNQQPQEIFQLLPITWQTISTFVTFLSVLVALFLPSFLNRRKLKITSYIVRIVSGHPNIPTSPEMLSTTIVNQGRNSITINNWGSTLLKSKKHLFIISDPPFNLPKTLLPTESYTLLNPTIETINKMKSIYVVDSWGKLWHSPRKNMKALRLRLETKIDGSGTSPNSAQPASAQ